MTALGENASGVVSNISRGAVNVEGENERQRVNGGVPRCNTKGGLSKARGGNEGTASGGCSTHERVGNESAAGFGTRRQRSGANTEVSQGGGCSQKSASRRGCRTQSERKDCDLGFKRTGGGKQLGREALGMGRPMLRWAVVKVDSHRFVSGGVESRGQKERESETVATAKKCCKPVSTQAHPRIPTRFLLKNAVKTRSSSRKRSKSLDEDKTSALALATVVTLRRGAV
ncbi:hypothetical protein R3P38DRAFT_2805831 [Favolaschia claudopus]|uniref:Uncharacterized protein n=1 Tax=Favolaschia claudopus TaxID=2862362 RepID=A0AAV9ZLJ7_9AGAR